MSELEIILGDEAISFLTHLRSIRELHKMCTAVELQNSEEVINDFKISFNFLFDNHNSDTLVVSLSSQHMQQ